MKNKTFDESKIYELKSHIKYIILKEIESEQNVSAY